MAFIVIIPRAVVSERVGCRIVFSKIESLQVGSFVRYKMDNLQKRYI